ncbi:carboxypeptidase regulatory-like domain-containing protein [Acinetobacter proteolyticus]|uniref:carboxypeptidase regulatory-like domain-containing protein n=1 Tax=Acinetobacter proteolyticus TaxID=1776741 RepID=UPI0031D5AA97
MMLIGLNVKGAVCNTTESNLLDNLKGLSIKGQVRELNIPYPCQVRLIERSTGRVIMNKATDQFGNYEFDHLKVNKFTIIAHHPLNTYNAVIADLVVPK